MKTLNIVWTLFCVYQASTISNKEITAPFSTMIAAKDEDFAIDKMREYDAIQDLRLNLDFRVFESLKEGEKFFSSDSNFKVVFGYFVRDLTFIKQTLENTLLQVLKIYLKPVITQFMNFESDEIDIYTAIPVSYSLIDLKELKLDHIKLQAMFSNVRRVGWIIAQRESGTTSKEEVTWVKKALGISDSIIDGLIRTIKTNEGLEAKLDSDGAIEALKRIKQLIINEERALDKGDSDWADFEPFLRLGSRHSLNLFENLRKKLFELIGNFSLESNYFMGDILDIAGEICLLANEDQLSAEIQPLAKQVVSETISFILENWNRVRKLVLDAKVSVEGSFKMNNLFVKIIVNLFSQMGTENKIVDPFYKQLLERTQKILENVKHKQAAIDGIDLLESALRDHSFKEVFEDYYWTGLNHNAYMLLLCMILSDPSRDQISELKNKITIKFLAQVFAGLDYVESNRIEELKQFAYHLSDSKLLLKNQKLTESYLSALVYYLTFSKQLPPNEFSILKATVKGTIFQKIKAQSRNHPYFGLLELALLAESSDPHECLSTQKFNSDHFPIIEKLLETHEFASLLDCLQVGQANALETASSLDNLKDAAKLNIDVKIKEPNKVKGTILVEIEFLGGSEYRVKYEFVGTNSSK